MQPKILCLVLVVALIFIHHVEAEDDEDLDNKIDERNNDKDKRDTPEDEGLDPNRSNDNDDEDANNNEKRKRPYNGNDDNNDEEDETPVRTNRGLDLEPMKPEEIKHRGLKCIPGRTTVSMERTHEIKQQQDYDDDDNSRRTHMNWQEDKSKEDCKICTCSIEGKDEVCSGRPARNLNECLVLAKLTEDLNSNMPFSHERELSNRIRRYGDLLWHNDEIPYEATAKCRRGFSYYTNNYSAKDTTIEDIPDNINSLLDYSSPDICYYCVCSASARSVECVPRDPWFCEHYRTIRQRGAIREYYAKMFQQDRPSYFRTLSYRLRRTMDWGLADMVDIAQKKLRRPACIPYVSEYSDCSEYTTCQGCNQCRCSAEGQWLCYKKKNTCSENDEMEIFEDGTDDNFVGKILIELADKERKENPKKKPTHLAPLPEKRQRATPPPPVYAFAAEDAMNELHKLIRGTRSLKDLNDTHTPIQFHHTVDEINEDTLKNSNVSGTLGVRKIAAVPSISRRSGVLINSSSDPLHIEYNNPTIYNNHITDNKIETSHNADHDDALVKDKIHNLVNYTQNFKDKELSKIVVNELKKGTETIGDPKAPVASNITFTPEKDALTAMAFIAGNLLNKLWNLEKDATDDSLETDNMKNQKIADLLELFKEPLTYRQESFLKDALEHLSEAVNKNKGNKHFSLCETVDEMKKDLIHPDERQDHKKEEKKAIKDSKGSDPVNALSKLNELLDLVKKYEVVKKTINNIKHPEDTAHVRVTEKPALRINVNDSDSLNLFGNILEKITNLLMPNNKRIKNKIRNQNILRNDHKFEEDVKKTFNIDLDAMKLTSADKLILDYINRLQTNPCSLPHLQEDMSMTNRQSDILLNLSEFFKIKSYSDLMNIVHPPKISTTQVPPTTTPFRTTSLYVTPTKYDDSRRTVDNKSEVDFEANNKLSITNDKLKRHLKEIVNDLIELENAKGKDIKSGDINIADALPCIFKILNHEDYQPKAQKQFTQSALLNKIKNVLEAVKKDIREIPLSRRSMDTGPRPKSAVVWERIVKNLDENPKPSRRFFKIEKPQSYDIVKKMIHHLVPNKSETYKSTALNKDVPATDKLLFLKTLLMDTGKYANVLGKLLVLNREKKLPENDLDELLEFVDIANENLELNTKILKDLNETRPKRLGYNNNQALKGNLNEGRYTSNNFKITNEEALNQLIKHRVKEFLKMKEDEKATGDMGYEIGQRILSNLERGSDKLARELYKVLLDSSQREKSTASKPIMRTRTAEKRPIRLGDPSTNQWTSEDLFLKTLESAWPNFLKSA